ncbi:MATE family efflux transporter [Nordella sp. HKS 07]|uniref:MATE family efflux transporter n=1 Tax=Nordella sp. HKS 07 TaxID=2712222 RepID=UPI0013E1356C|nr:MATE family efflux transporter [Nordella sp. HKS 07]QIG49157.1 MATE family efflux transporter [Nordella sp. HKS 07]
MSSALTSEARFVTGSTMRHVVVMTFTGALGLMSMFLVDLADLFYLSLLGKTEITAAIGYAGTVVFTNLSLCIGTGIAAAVLVARNLGAKRPERAREFATSCFMYSCILSAVFSGVIALAADWLLRLLGAEGEALHLAKQFIWIASPGFVVLAGGIACSFTLRGLGDARRAMYVTLVVAIVIAILDPIFIFGLGWGIQGAALAGVIADLCSLAVGFHSVHRVHNFFAPPSWARLRADLREISEIAVPAMLTQLATPFANAYATRAVAPFGNEAVAAAAIIGRIIPVAFGIIFSLSGSVGPIIGQNYGARAYDRVRRTLTDGLIFATIYTLVAAALLYVFRHDVAELFRASGRTIDLVVFFCSFIAASWAFTGAQFVASAAFNNLGHPNTSTVFNWAKATIGTIPFALYGAHVAGPEGVMVGVALGSIIFGVASVAWAYRIVAKVAQQKA